MKLVKEAKEDQIEVELEDEEEVDNIDSMKKENIPTNKRTRKRRLQETQGMEDLIIHVLIARIMTISLPIMDIVLDENYVERANTDVEPTVLLAYKGEDKENATIWSLGTRQVIICVDKRSMFMEFDELIGEHLIFVDSKISVKGGGKILICLKNENHQLISIIYYLPKMKHNILSLEHLLEKGYDILMKYCSLLKKTSKTTISYYAEIL